MIERTIPLHREPMPSSDVAWLRMDSEENLMVVTGVFLLAQPVSLTRLRRVVEERFLVFDRFRQRIVTNLTGASLEPDPNFDIANHVKAVRRGSVRGKKGLQRLVGRMASWPLDHSRPLWRMDLVPHYGGGSAVILRIHHCYADGIALIQVLLSLTDREREASIPKSRPGGEARRPRQSRGILESIVAPLEQAAGATFAAANDLWEESIHALRHPSTVLDIAAAGADTVEEILKTAMTPADPPSRLHQPLSGVKRVAWAEPVPLDRIKPVSKALGCTVNDVLVSCATGALRDYLLEQGDDADSLEFRAEIPVNMRPPGQDFRSLGNQFGLVLLDLPIGIGNPFERLFEVHRRMEALKQSRQPLAAYVLLNLMGRLPETLEKLMLQFFTLKATAVMTNVPGPAEPLYFAGAELGQVLFWVPQAGSVGIGISILSYRGEVQIGLIADDNLIPDPDVVVSRFATEFETLASRVQLKPLKRARAGGGVTRARSSGPSGKGQTRPAIRAESVRSTH